jgi:hypothetical protein|tara:strand:- start:517 stop:666 length:150 start_codon:yes stop_codon:yes gene_type:complete
MLAVVAAVQGRPQAVLAVAVVVAEAAGQLTEPLVIMQMPIQDQVVAAVV